MWKLVALATYVAGYGACLAAVRGVRRRALGLDAALAAAVFLCGEALVVHALSPLHAVGRGGLLAGNALLTACAAALAWAQRARLRPIPRPGRLLQPCVLPLLLLGAAILVSALAYVPNNWDSMTYHLARVAHWLQRGTVAAYPTGIPRQIVYFPGAEYLLLGLQGISGSDRLAALVQLCAWGLIALAAAPLARLLGAPRGLARLAPILAAAGPLAVQEASSTQNDLVAGLLAVSMVAAALPFLHRRPSWRAGDLALVMLTVAAGALTKATSSVAAAPFLLWGAAGFVVTLRGRTAWRRVALALPAAAVAAGVAGPYLWVRASVPPVPGAIAPYVYSGLGELPDRAVNVLRGVARNVPLPLAVLDRLAPERTEGCDRPHSLCLYRNWQLDEDYTGSLGPALVVLAALLVGVVRRRRLPARAGWSLLCMGLAWVLFQFTFRDNVWVPRLHLAYLALAPAALGAFGGLRGPGRVGRLAAGLVAAGLVVHAGVAAVRTYRRPLHAKVLHAAHGDAGYYRGAPREVRAQHDAVLSWLATSGCRRLGLVIGGDSADYPLTWRAMRQQVEVRHLAGDSEWPCVVFSDLGKPPGDWIAADPALTFLYVPAR